MDKETSLDLKQIMEENEQIETQYPRNSFMYQFWKQQREALGKKDLRGMRWHPMMIRWCLYLRHHSNKAYEVLRNAGLFLPSQRTLRDYTYYTKSATGFSSSVDEQLLLASKGAMFICQSWQFLAQCFLPFLTIFNTILCQLLPYLAILDIPICHFWQLQQCIMQALYQ